MVRVVQATSARARSERLMLIATYVFLGLAGLVFVLWMIDEVTAKPWERIDRVFNMSSAAFFLGIALVLAVLQ